MGCVYRVTCLANNKQYIGKTKHSLERRRIQHHSYAKNHTKSLFHKALLKYGHDAFRWEVLYQSDDELALYQKEKEYIVECHTMVPTGYNLTTGGDGNYNVHFDDAWRVKNKARAVALGKSVYCVETDNVYTSIAEASRILQVSATSISGCCRRKEHRSNNMHHFCYNTVDAVLELKDAFLRNDLNVVYPSTEIARFNRSQAQKGKKMSPEFCARRREIMLQANPWKGKHPSEDALVKMSENRKGKCLGTTNGSAHAVYCIELDKTFSPIKQAGEELELPKKAGSNISSCCTGRIPSAYGYHWRYADGM